MPLASLPPIHTLLPGEYTPRRPKITVLCPPGTRSHRHPQTQPTRHAMPGRNRPSNYPHSRNRTRPSWNAVSSPEAPPTPAEHVHPTQPSSGRRPRTLNRPRSDLVGQLTSAAGGKADLKCRNDRSSPESGRSPAAPRTVKISQKRFFDRGLSVKSVLVRAAGVMVLSEVSAAMQAAA